jgi:hypothetical protein
MVGLENLAQGWLLLLPLILLPCCPSRDRLDREGEGGLLPAVFVLLLTAVLMLATVGILGMVVYEEAGWFPLVPGGGAILVDVMLFKWVRFSDAAFLSWFDLFRRAVWLVPAIAACLGVYFLLRHARKRSWGQPTLSCSTR